MIYAWLGQTLTDAIETGNIARYLLLEAGAEAPVKVDTGETDFGPRLEQEAVAVVGRRHVGQGEPSLPVLGHETAPPTTATRLDCNNKNIGPGWYCECNRPCPMSCRCPCHDLKES